MSAGNSSFGSRNKIVPIPPALVDDNTAATAWTSIHDALRVVGVINVGATDITLNAKVQEADDSSGTNPVDVTGAAVTEYTATDDNELKIIDVETVKFSKPYARLIITVDDGTTGAYVSGMMILPSRHRPVTQPAAVSEIVEVAG